MAQCRGYGAIAAHEAEASAFSAGKTRCRACTAAYFKDWAANRKSAPKPPKPQPQAEPAVNPAPVAAAPIVKPTEHKPDPVTSNGHTYRPDPELVSLWDAAVASAVEGDPLAIAMHGPSGCGKTDGARYLANRAGLEFVKIDCKSMIDAEAWFGTRGAADGTTFYTPSAFVEAITRPSVVFLDEYTRVTNDVRDVLNPLLDGTRVVTNPITGERIKMHPECLVMLAGNVGYRYSGTFEVDPALTSRVLVHNLDYPKPEDERAILAEATGIGDDAIDRLIRFATETRSNPQMTSVSTRELLAAGRLIRHGLDESRAVHAAVIAATSDEGGVSSARAKLDTLWAGIATPKTEAEDSAGAALVTCTYCGDALQAVGSQCNSCGNLVTQA